MFIQLLAEFSENSYSLWNPDWSQFWPSIIATVVGFGLAIVFQQVIYDAIKDNITNRNKAINQIQRICEELGDIIEILSSDAKSGETLDPESTSYIDPIKTPIWDAILNTNEIQNIVEYFESKTKPHWIFKKRNKIVAFDLSKELFGLYSLIAEYNEWNNLSTQQVLLSDTTSDEDKKIVLETIEKVKQRILEDERCNIRLLLKTLTDILPDKKKNDKGRSA